MKKRILSVLLTLCMLLGMLPGTALAASSDLPFTDVTVLDWFSDAVEYVYEEGLMSGTSKTTFSPDDTTTRGMIVTILHHMEGTPEALPADFSDVEADAYYAAAVDWAAENGIVAGRKNWLFANTPVGAQSSAVIYSLLETAKENKLDPYRYLLWMLESAPGLARDTESWAEQCSN